MREAATVEASVEKHPVTPGTLYPPYEALGDLFSVLDRPSEALEAYAASLSIWPKRYRSVLGAARAARALDDAERASTYYNELLTVVGDTETYRSGVAEAKAFLEG